MYWWMSRSDGNVAEQMQKAAAEKGTDLLETWLILEYCDQGSFDHAIRSGQYTNDLVSACNFHNELPTS